MGCFVHVILLGVGCFVSLQKTCGGFRPPITKWTCGVLSVGCFVRIPASHTHIFLKTKQDLGKTQHINEEQPKYCQQLKKIVNYR